MTKDQGMTHRVAIVLLGLFAAIAHAAPEAQAVWPTRPIKLIVPFPAGGPTDIVARPFAEALSAFLKQPVVLENRGGAGGTIGAAAAAKSAPDGYTFLLGTVGTQAINPALYPKLAYNPVKDFKTVAILAAAPVALVANPAVPASNIAELAALAEKRPLRFGSAGNGTPGHLTGELFKTASGVALTHVPYRGSAPAAQDLLGGHIELMFDPLQSVLAYVKAGKLQALAISSAQSVAALPSAVTFLQAGVKVETAAWWGIFAPAETPDAIVAQFAKAIYGVRDTAVVKALEDIGLLLQTPRDSRQLEEFLLAEREKWGKAVRDSGAGID
ncbi:MAG: tripartite tricarboxylate transporter substrate binding protein [Zoogloeaceae bacterium]|jgi:tripartite-type tricarboxylate transporter receptor subunit TctC|nr:tripartite tricarboxylate transporter substrate binding protein [Zoogloeaceae bacterium]